VQLDFWIDPVCPWCWLTSRWVVDVAPHRDLDVRWRPISLLMKNNTTPESPFYDVTRHSLGLLRVMESVRAAEGDAPLGALYGVYGEHIHERGDRFVDPARGLGLAGLPTSHAAAFEDSSFDAVIAAAMDEGLSLTGPDVGTPILGFDDLEGRRVGWFGPVISRRLAREQALRLWDGVVAVASVPHMWELKRTRTESPAFGPPGD
jgi:2-hydroxychromene-2-carboxylate isomerase